MDRVQGAPSAEYALRARRSTGSRTAAPTLQRRRPRLYPGRAAQSTRTHDRLTPGARRSAASASPRPFADATRLSRLVQRAGELAARLARHRVLDPEVVEHADDGAAQILAAVALVVGDRADQLVEPALGLAGVERGERAASAGSCSRRMRAARPSAANEPPTLPSTSSASSSSPRSCSSRASATAASARPGSSSSAWRSDCLVAGLRPARRPPTGSSSSRNRSTCGGGCAPTNSRDDLAVLERLDGRDALDAERGGELLGLASVSSLASATLPSRSFTSRSSTGVELAARAAPLGPEVDDHGISCERSMTSCSKVASVVSKITTTRIAGR